MLTYENLINNLDRDNLFLYLGQDIPTDIPIEKSAVLFTHYLARTGAPSMLLTMSKVLLEKGYQVFLVSPVDGEMCEDFTDIGVNVIVYPDLLNDKPWLTEIAKTFDFVLVNTLACGALIQLLAPLCSRIYWWIHEFEPNFIDFYPLYKNFAITPSLQILAASLRIQKNIKKYLHLESELLNFYVEDTPGISSVIFHPPIRFLQVGLIAPYKGQLLLLDAIKQLPDTIHNQCLFTFCGDFDSADPAILLQLQKAMESDTRISLIPSMPREELLHYYDEIDVIVVPSYEESTSAIAVEALMKEKLCICSDGCGICDFLHDGIDSFFFPSGNSPVLAEKIRYVVTHFTELDSYKAAGRQIYETYYSKQVFSKRLSELHTFQKLPACNPNLCSGCNACYEICPIKCIHVEKDCKGFLYPSIDYTRCTHCGLCKNVCPVNAPLPPHNYTNAYGLKISDLAKRKESQSGGAFTAFAEYILRNSGIVYGVGLDHNLTATYMRINSLNDLSLLKGSKYVQAELLHIFPLVAQDILANKTVFFSGTSCHIAGLYNYLHIRHIRFEDRLYTCDLICHGVPSPILYQDYLRYLSQLYGTVSDFCFRDKSIAGWHKHSESFQLPSHYKYSDTIYTSLFYTNFFLRESCYACPYACSDRITDITIGDFWGIEKQKEQEDDNIGVSLVMLHTQKAESIWDEIKNECSYFTADSLAYQQHNLNFPTVRPAGTDIAWHEYLTFGFKYICQTYGSRYTNVSIIKDSLQVWKEKLNRGENFSSYFQSRNIDSVILCGNMTVNKLLIREFVTFHLSIPCIIDLYEEEIMPMIENIPVRKKADIEREGISSDSCVLITDEVHLSSITEFLSEKKVSPTHLIPLSFLASEEL